MLGAVPSPTMLLSSLLLFTAFSIAQAATGGQFCGTVSSTTDLYFVEVWTNCNPYA